MRSLVYLLPLLTLVVASCDSATKDPPATVQPRELTAQEARVLAADNGFTFRLFKEVVREDADKNVFLSPFSASMALGMTMNGARGETRAAMETALGKSGLSAGEINAAYRGLLDLLPHLDPKVTFTIANSIWSRNTFRVEQAFIDTNRRSFDAEVRSLDFSDPQAADVINRWVYDRTRGKIERIVDPPIQSDVMMYLINALYFKGTWRFAFDPQHTRDDVFRLQNGGTAAVKMMNQSGRFAHYQNDRLSALDLPYGDSLYSMTILLPRASQSLDVLVADLDDAMWRGITSGLRRSEIDVQLPRLKLAYEVQLRDPLSRLGMGIAFSDQADFSGINRDLPLAISRVKQKTFVEVNEEGTEAAAVTAVEVAVTSAPPLFRVDRPFVFALREGTTGAILFIGRILNPAS